MLLAGQGNRNCPCCLSPTLVCSLAEVVRREILLFAEALEEEGVNIKVKEKDLNKKLWKGGCSFLHCRKDTGQRMVQTIL